MSDEIVKVWFFDRYTVRSGLMLEAEYVHECADAGECTPFVRVWREDKDWTGWFSVAVPEIRREEPSVEEMKRLAIEHTNKLIKDSLEDLERVKKNGEKYLREAKEDVQRAYVLNAKAMRGEFTEEDWEEVGK